MTSQPNAEEINDRAKLMTHRILARLLTFDPDLIGRARQVIVDKRSRGQPFAYLDEWDRLLALDLGQLRRLITARSERMTRLRSSSPLGLASGVFIDEGLRNLQEGQ